jgi:DNA-binding transcriptional ArsR family regulator
MKKAKKTTYSEIKKRLRPELARPAFATEKELCPDCFKVVGVPSRYKIVCFLGKRGEGATVTEITDVLGLKQPTVTHHLNILKSVAAVYVEERGREHVYRLDRHAHCFAECQIPY